MKLPLRIAELTTPERLHVCIRGTFLVVQRCLAACVGAPMDPLDWSNCCSLSNSCNHLALGPRNGTVPGFVLVVLFLPSSFPFRLVMCNAVFFFCAVIPACHLRCLAQCLCPATAGCEHLHFFPSFLVHRVVIWYMCSSSIRSCSSSSSAIPPPSSSSRLRSPFGSGFSHGTCVQDVGRRRLRARAGHLRSNHVHVFHVEGPAASNFTSCAHAFDRSVAASTWKVTAGAGAARRNPVTSQTLAPTRAIHPNTDDVHVQSAFQSPFERLDSPWLVFLFFFSARATALCLSERGLQFGESRAGTRSCVRIFFRHVLRVEERSEFTTVARHVLCSCSRWRTSRISTPFRAPTAFRSASFSRVEVPCLLHLRFGSRFASARDVRRSFRALHAPRLQVDAWPSCESTDVAQACAPLCTGHVGRRGAFGVHEGVNPGSRPSEGSDEGDPNATGAVDGGLA